ncbi:MAG: class I SAM-dependent methyltransferase [Bacteroidota bacterium]
MQTNTLRASLSAHKEMKTFYSNSFDRLTGGHTVTWNTQGKEHRIKSHIRFTDFEGHWPDLGNVRFLPKMVKSWWESRNTFILDEPVPFLVYESIEFLEGLVRPGMKVLEVGGGNSSLWFLSKGVNLTTIEHDWQWADTVCTQARNRFGGDVMERFNMQVIEGEEAYEFIQQQEADFDLVLVDGMNHFTSRNKCVELSLPKVKQSGWMVIDNSDHPINWQGVDHMKAYEKIRFTGYAPMNLFVSQTCFWQIK